MVSGSQDHKVYMWSVSRPAQIWKLEGHKAPVLAVDCHPKLNMIVSGATDPDPTVKIWANNWAGGVVDKAGPE